MALKIIFDSENSFHNAEKYIFLQDYLSFNSLLLEEKYIFSEVFS